MSGERRLLTTWDDVRPRTPPPIGAFQAELDRQVSRAIDAVVVEQAMVMHGDLWGIPVGPTLSMVHPPKMLGLNWLTERPMPAIADARHHHV